ncbi:ATP-binding cassette domain-containing protein [Neomoorella thermoacetica]|uniref:ATP-binding cassette domain-containing protein n=1 Tax=Neomoorella thermoacetica TaxID=1525 RepID=UPI0008FAAAD3|nr:SkfA peptide export ATP-binding protein SkfE [Moorella thermoacetica]
MSANVTPALKVEGLTKKYGNKTVLTAISFTIQAGECVALLGPNGAGKTTLLRCLGGILWAPGLLVLAGEILRPELSWQWVLPPLAAVVQVILNLKSAPGVYLVVWLAVTLLLFFLVAIISTITKGSPIYCWLPLFPDHR